jgi:hypothetical protein
MNILARARRKDRLFRERRVWRKSSLNGYGKVHAGDRVIGYFFVDHVTGKHLYIDYSVALGADGRVRRVEPVRIWRRRMVTCRVSCSPGFSSTHAF